MKAKKIAKQRAMQQAERYRKAHVTTMYLSWAIDAETQRRHINEMEECSHCIPESQLECPLPRPKGMAESDEPVDVYFSLTYPLTDNVPESARESNFKARTVAEVCHEVRRVYEAIYAEDVRLGGLTADEYRATHPEYPLLNRPVGPWVWGHDIEDLAIEFLDFDWITPTHVHVDVFIGS